MIKESTDVDELTGLRTTIWRDEHEDIIHFEYSQDLQPLVDMNKNLHNTDYQKEGIKNSWMHAATIPPSIQMKWMQEYGIKDVYNPYYRDLIVRLVNSPDYKYLRTGSLKL